MEEDGDTSSLICFLLSFLAFIKRKLKDWCRWRFSFRQMSSVILSIFQRFRNHAVKIVHHCMFYPLPCVNGSSMKYLKYSPNCLIHQQFAPILKHRRSEPVVNYWNGSAVFLLDGKDKSEKDNQVTGFTFKLLLSVRDCLHIVVSDVSEILIR